MKVHEELQLHVLDARRTDRCARVTIGAVAVPLSSFMSLHAIFILLWHFEWRLQVRAGASVRGEGAVKWRSPRTTRVHEAARRTATT